jgi:hypothetical protein
LVHCVDVNPPCLHHADGSKPLAIVRDRRGVAPFGILVLGRSAVLPLKVDVDLETLSNLGIRLFAVNASVHERVLIKLVSMSVGVLVLDGARRPALPGLCLLARGLEAPLVRVAIS